MHLVGFIIRIYDDARSPERHKRSDAVPIKPSEFLQLKIVQEVGYEMKGMDKENNKIKLSTKQIHVSIYVKSYRLNKAQVAAEI